MTATRPAPPRRRRSPRRPHCSRGPCTSSSRPAAPTPLSAPHTHPPSHSAPHPAVPRTHVAARLESRRVRAACLCVSQSRSRADTPPPSPGAQLPSSSPGHSGRLPRLPRRLPRLPRRRSAYKHRLSPAHSRWRAPRPAAGAAVADEDGAVVDEVHRGSRPSLLRKVAQQLRAAASNQGRRPGSCAKSIRSHVYRRHGAASRRAGGTRSAAWRPRQTARRRRRPAQPAAARVGLVVEAPESRGAQNAESCRIARR